MMASKLFIPLAFVAVAQSVQFEDGRCSGYEAEPYEPGCIDGFMRKYEGKWPNCNAGNVAFAPQTLGAAIEGCKQLEGCDGFSFRAGDVDPNRVANGYYKLNCWVNEGQSGYGDNAGWEYWAPCERGFGTPG